MAATAKQAQTIRDIFRDKTRGRELFTSVDVHKQFGKEKLRHIAIRDVLHTMHHDGEVTQLGYERTLEPMNNGFDAFVYHPRGVSPSHYTNRDQTLGWDSGPDMPINSPPPSTPAARPGPQVGVILPARYEKRQVRGDGAIEIPRPVLKMLGDLSTGDRLYGYFDNGSHEIVVTSRKPKGISAKCFFVYTKGGTRVPKSLVTKHLGSQRTFQLTATQGELRITDQ